MQTTMNVSVDRPIPFPTRPTSPSKQSDHSPSPTRTPTHPNSPSSPIGTVSKAVYLPISVRGIGM